MTSSLNDVFSRFLKPFSEALSARNALRKDLSEFTLEDFRELHRLKLEQDLARERQRAFTALGRPFNGLL
jgi:hypothetical protein